MLRLLALTAVLVVLGIALAPRIVPILSWGLAFLILLMLGDLLLSELRKHRGWWKKS